MINIDVLRRKANLGSDRDLVDNLDFLYPDNFTKGVFKFFFALRMGQGGIGWLMTGIRLLTGLIAILPIYLCLVILQLYLSMIISFVRLFKVKNLFVDGSFFVMFVAIHNLLILPYVISGGETLWLNTYIFKLPTWLFDALIFV